MTHDLKVGSEGGNRVVVKNISKYFWHGWVRGEMENSIFFFLIETFPKTLFQNHQFIAD